MSALASQYRVCRTATGRLCREGSPEAAFLAYAIGDQVEIPEQAAYLKLFGEDDAPKKKPAPANKQKAPAANKDASTTGAEKSEVPPGSGAPELPPAPPL